MAQTPFESFFNKATGFRCRPYAFQERFARDLPCLVRVPTGLGKTAMAVLGWLWRRQAAGKTVRRETPRRLVYCLPMRVLVEQTCDEARKWLSELGLGETVKVHVLMGGERADDWDLLPERDAIIVGTQDMLLSRALNRGYAAGRARWPMQFGLLHTDCLWVFDEIQLMGAGLATTTQVEAFRRRLPEKDADMAKDGHGCCSVWMSATLDEKWLETVDFKGILKDVLKKLPHKSRLTFDFDEEIKTEGLDDKARKTLEDRWNADKPLAKAEATMGEAEALASEILQAHKPGTRTIVVVNTVKGACKLFGVLNDNTNNAPASNKKSGRLRIVLLHSRFRPGDRNQRMGEALDDPPPEGTIVVSTQVIEAGVDVSATTLFTELAPWASLVQRFGRCNRRGEENEQAAVRWIDVPDKDAVPYNEKDLKESRGQLQAIGKKPEDKRNVGLRWLPDVQLKFEHTHVIRRKDLIDLFDTTPDLAGNDIDIDRFVREVEDSGVRVFWRDYGDIPNHADDKEAEPAPRREELCLAPIGSQKNPGFREFAKRHKGKVWRWNFLDKAWQKADAARITPGQVFLVHADAGGYSAERGWDLTSTSCVDPASPLVGAKDETPDATDDDWLSRIGVWQTIAEHTNEVCKQLDATVNALSLDGNQVEALRTAARWHDWGKAHEMFQIKIDDGQELAKKDPPGGPKHRRERDGEYKSWHDCQFVAKAPGVRKDHDGKVVDPGFWTRLTKKAGGRWHFRHELASALAVLQRPHGSLRQLSDNEVDLVAYLIAAHHGKVRLSIRSLPNEMRPRDDEGRRLDNCRFARGVWDSDALPATDLGGGVTAPAVTLSLEPMELGLCEHPPFAGQPSWAERMIRLRDTLGPFRLAYLEALLRVADMRASAAAQQHAAAEPSSSSVGVIGKEAPNG